MSPMSFCRFAFLCSQQSIRQISQKLIGSVCGHLRTRIHIHVVEWFRLANGNKTMVIHGWRATSVWWDFLNCFLFLLLLVPIAHSRSWLNCWLQSDFEMLVTMGAIVRPPLRHAAALFYFYSERVFPGKDVFVSHWVVLVGFAYIFRIMLFFKLGISPRKSSGVRPKAVKSSA